MASTLVSCSADEDSAQIMVVRALRYVVKGRNEKEKLTT